MSTETMSLEEARQERERTLRILMNTRVQYKALYDACPKDADGNPTPTPELSQQLRDYDKQIPPLKAQLAGQESRLRQMENAAELHGLMGTPANPRPMFEGGDGGGGGCYAQGTSAHKSLTLGTALMASEEVKAWQHRSRNSASIEMDFRGFQDALKAPLVSTGLTSYDRLPSVVGQLQQRLTVADLLASGQTNATTIRYLRETTRSHAVGNVAENSVKPEQPFAFVEVDAPVRKIAGYLKMSDELMNDYPAVRSFIDAQLPFEVKYREEQQLLNGTGLSNQITGILATPGIQTYAKAVAPENNADAVFKAMMKIMSIGFMEPDGVVMHPNNWQAVRLMKETTEGYIYGHPSVVGPNTLWGVPVVITNAITANTALVGAFKRAAQIFYREGVRIEMTNCNEDDFINNRITVVGEERLTLAVYYPAGFSTVTALV